MTTAHPSTEAPAIHEVLDALSATLDVLRKEGREQRVQRDTVEQILADVTALRSALVPGKEEPSPPGTLDILKAIESNARRHADQLLETYSNFKEVSERQGDARIRLLRKEVDRLLMVMLCTAGLLTAGALWLIFGGGSGG